MSVQHDLINKFFCVFKNQVGVQAGLFHGGKSLCEPQTTIKKEVTDAQCKWEEDLQFDLEVCNIPRAARLCFVVYEMSKSAKGVKSKRLKDGKQVGLSQLKFIL